MEFRGTYTALVTPFNASDGHVDYGKLRALLEEQIAGGVEGVVPVGTSGESPTLSYEEHDKVISTVCDCCRGRVQVVAGTGANSTREAVELTRHAISDGADATLQIAPYYNKPTPEGLYRHFAEVADVGLPVLLYNAPGRTSRDIPVAVVKRLADHPKIAGIKEAAGDANRVNLIRAAVGDQIDILSGDDSLTLPMMAAGAKGVVSVASNVVPAEVVEMVRLALANDFAGALRIHTRLLDLFADLFIEVNPVPVKAAMAMLGTAQEVYRLPLCEMRPENREKLKNTIEKLGLVK
jgi:4-hydroxy-tetrahydrodipicolinate synthase